MAVPEPISRAASPQVVASAGSTTPFRYLITRIDDSGRCSGHVDLGSLGVADRWADIAVATMSLNWNYGPQWQETFLEAYGIKADQERTAYYRDLYNLGL